MNQDSVCPVLLPLVLQKGGRFLVFSRSAGFSHDEFACGLSSWNEESPAFNRLKRLAFVLKIEEVIVSPYSVFPNRDEFDLYFGNEIDFEFAREWGLSKRQTQSLTSSAEPSIFINYRAEFPTATLAHEIGHHIYRLARFTEIEKSRPISKALNRLFP